MRSKKAVSFAISSGNGANKWEVFNKTSTLWLICPTKTIEALAFFIVTVKSKVPFHSTLILLYFPLFQQFPNGPWERLNYEHLSCHFNIRMSPSKLVDFIEFDVFSMQTSLINWILSFTGARFLSYFPYLRFFQKKSLTKIN